MSTTALAQGPGRLDPARRTRLCRSSGVTATTWFFEGIELDGYRIEAQGNTRPVVNLTWMASDRLGVELLASWPFKHDIDGDQALSALGKLGSTKHLPPTLSLQYHFRPNQTFRPYGRYRRELHPVFR